MGTAEAAPATQKKNRTSNPDLSYPNLSQPYTTKELLVHGFGQKMTIFQIFLF